MPPVPKPIKREKKKRKRIKNRRYGIDAILDEVFALYIKCRDGWKCVICEKGYEVDEKLKPSPCIIYKAHSSGLGASHYFGRRTYGSVKYDEENVDSLCTVPCHAEAENMKTTDYLQFKTKQLGEDGCDKLFDRARKLKQFRGKDKQELLRHYLNKIKELRYCVDNYEKYL